MKRFSISALVGAAAALLPACFESPATGPLGLEGVTRVLLTDAPFPYGFVDRVEVYVVEIAASTEADTLPGSQAWASIAEPSRRFDLLTLQQGSTALVGEGDLPAGEYLAVRMTIDTDSSAVTFIDGREAKVRWPVAGALSLFALVEEPLAVPDAGAQIVIDFDVGRSFAYGLFSPLYDFVFIPFIRAVNSAATGTLTGIVMGDANGDGLQEPLENAAITVFRGDPGRPANTWWVTATGHTDDDGAYTVAFLLQETYIVQIDAPLTTTLGPTTTPGVEVIAGRGTVLSVTLPALDASSITIEGTRSMAVGDTTLLHAVVRDGNGVIVEHPSVRWRSLNAAVARVSDIGEYATAFAVAPGVAPIVATSLGLSDSISVVVNGADTSAVSTVSIVPDSLTLSVGDSVSVSAVVRNAQGTPLAGRTVTWATSDSAIARVFGTEQGTALVQAVAAGNAAITATSEGRSGTVVVNVDQ